MKVAFTADTAHLRLSCVLYRLMLAKDWSAYQLGLHAGLPFATVNNVVLGKRASKLLTYNAILNAFDSPRTLDWLVAESERVTDEQLAAYKADVWTRMTSG